MRKRNIEEVRRKGNIVINIQQLKHLPQGLSSATVVFANRLHHILKEVPKYPGVTVRQYVDDIIIGATDEASSSAALAAVLAVLNKYELKLNPSKLQRNVTEVDFLGYTLGARGTLTIEQSKLKAIAELATPTNVTELRSLLGITGFLRKFVPHYAEITAPLHVLTANTHSKMKRVDGNTVGPIVERLKTLILQSKPLSTLDSNLDLYIEVDASQFGSGACFYQLQKDEKRIIGFHSHGFSSAEINYSVTERELCGAIHAVKSDKRFRVLRRIIIYTDHKPLTHLRDKDVLTVRLLRLYSKLDEYPVEFQYVQGVENVVADGLSRITTVVKDTQASYADSLDKVTVNAITRAARKRGVPATVDLEDALSEEDDIDQANDEAEAEVTSDETVTNISPPTSPSSLTASHMAYLMAHSGSLPAPWTAFAAKYIMFDNETSGAIPMIFVRFGEHLLKYLPDDEVILFMERVHNQMHGSPRLVTEALTSAGFWNPNTSVLSKSTVANCHLCSTFTTWNAVAHELGSVKSVAFGTTIHADYIELRHGDAETKYVLNVSEYVSGITWSFATPAQSMNHVFASITQGVFPVLVNVTDIVFDNANYFNSGILKEMFKVFNVKIHHSSNYNPASNGFVERRNQVFKSVLLKVLDYKLDNWSLVVGKVAMLMNSVKNVFGYSSFYLFTGTAPLEVTFSQETTDQLKKLISTAAVHSTDKVRYLLHLDAVALRVFELTEAKVEEDRSTNTSKKVRLRELRQIINNAGIAKYRFLVGELVMKRSREDIKALRKKTEPISEGPFIVSAALTQNAYKLVSLTGKVLGGTFNGSLLRPCYTHDGSPIRAASDVLKGLHEAERRYLNAVI